MGDRVGPLDHGGTVVGVDDLVTDLEGHTHLLIAGGGTGQGYDLPAGSPHSTGADLTAAAPPRTLCTSSATNSPMGARHVRVDRRAADDPRRGPAVRRRRRSARTSRSSSTATCRPTTSCASCSPRSAWTPWPATASSSRSSGRRRIAAGERGGAAPKAERRGGGDQRHRHDDDPDHRAVPRTAPAWSPRWACRWASRRPRSCRKGTIAQKERWALDLLTHGQGRRVGDHRAGLRLRRLRLDAVDRPPRRRRVRPQRLEDVHHQRPLRRHDRVHLQARRGQPARRSARSCRSCSTGACPASSSRSRCARWACTPRPPASCSSTTCGSGATASSARPRTCRAGGRDGAKATFSHGALRRRGDGARHHRASASSCASQYAKDRVQFGQPIGEFQLIQEKLARMEVARLNVQNLVFRTIEMSAAGAGPDAGRGVGDEAVLGPGRDRGGAGGGAALRRQRLHEPSSRSSSSPATPRCCRSTPAPTRSRSPTSPRTCSAAEARRSGVHEVLRLLRLDALLERVRRAQATVLSPGLERGHRCEEPSRSKYVATEHVGDEVQPQGEA